MSVENPSFIQKRELSNTSGFGNEQFLQIQGRRRRFRSDEQIKRDKERMKIYREQHKEEIRAYDKDYYQKHKLEHREASRRSRQKHSDEIKTKRSTLEAKENQRRYYQKYKDMIKSRRRRLRQTRT